MPRPGPVVDRRIASVVAGEVGGRETAGGGGGGGGGAVGVVADPTVVRGYCVCERERGGEGKGKGGRGGQTAWLVWLGFGVCLCLVGCWVGGEWGVWWSGSLMMMMMMMRRMIS